MEDFEYNDEMDSSDEEGGSLAAAEQTGLSFDDIVSFTMLLETIVTLVGMAIFFTLVLVGVL